MESDGQSDGREDKAASVKGLAQTWQKWSEDRKDYQKHNPFTTDEVMAFRPEWSQGDYGRPPEGSHTERRGKEAHSHVGKEVTEVCQIISKLGHRREDGSCEIEFSKLFEHYVSISNKLVGVLLRARKQGLVQFKGEMLWQGKDDQVMESKENAEIRQAELTRDIRKLELSREREIRFPDLKAKEFVPVHLRRPVPLEPAAPPGSFPPQPAAVHPTESAFPSSLP